MSGDPRGAHYRIKLYLQKRKLNSARVALSPVSELGRLLSVCSQLMAGGGGALQTVEQFV